MSDAPVHEGEILAGKYRVEKVLGIGGMGVVVAATHLQLDERVAIKFLIKDALSSGEAVARFAREARAAVKIKSEHVARVIDVGTLETGAPYMVMEYLEGGDLSQVLASRGHLPVEEAVEYVLQASEAIAHAHALGIVHRDLKPANLFLIRRPDGTNSVKVLDFGISKVMLGKSGSSEDSMTRTTAVMGSPLYMSPEQMASTRDVDGRTDLWALGAILYELVAGKPPFNAESMPQLCALILNSPAPSLRATRPQVPIALDAVLQRCLEKDPKRRYANIAEFAVAIGDFAPKHARPSIERITRIIQSASASESGAVIAGVPGGSVQTGGSWAETATGTRPSKSRKAVWIGAAVTVVLVVGGFAVARRTANSSETGPTVLAPPTLAAAPPAAPSLPIPSPPAIETAAVLPTTPAVSASAPKPEATLLKPGAKRPPPAARPPGAPVPPAPPAPPTPGPKPAPPADLFDDRK